MTAARTHARQMRRLAATLAAVVLPNLDPTAVAQTAAPATHVYQDVAKWGVMYDDLALGPVDGLAYCKWTPRHCDVVLRSPATKELHWLKSTEIDLPNAESGAITIRLDGQSPFRQAVSAPPAPQRVLRANDGDTVKIITRIGNADSEIAVETTVSARVPLASPLRVQLEPRRGGLLVGSWSYLSNPINERDTFSVPGKARVGIFTTLPDGELQKILPHDYKQAFNGGGFLGVQTGWEMWRPLLPRIARVLVLEDQAAFADGAARYPHARLSAGWMSKPVTEMRNLVVVGRDLPVHDGASLLGPKSKDDRLAYEVIAVDGGDHLTDRQKQQFERAWKDLTRDMTAAEAAEFRKLDAALIEIRVGDIDAGPQTFSWGTAEIKWDLQYGDNTADVRFVRVLNETEYERVEQLALPDEVVIEVETGNVMELEAIPLQIGGAGVALDNIEVIATRVSGKKKETVYRTPPIVFADRVENPAAATGGNLVVVRKGSRVLATVNRANTHFLRASIAAAVASEPTTLWTNALKRAADCKNARFSVNDWPSFAKTPTESVSRWGQTVAINYGDHAAMLMLRDAFLQAMRVHHGELSTAAKDAGLVDAWYGRMHAAVTQLRDYPLAAAEVPGPGGGGKVAFREAYSDEFKENNFHPSTTADGNDNYLKWRQGATKEAMAFVGREMDEAIKATEKIEDCDRQELVKLTGSGFNNVSSRLAPILMKRRADARVTEPDYLARAYIKNLDVLANRVAAIKAFATQVNTAIVTAVLVVIPPAAEAAWATAGLAGAEGAGILIGTVGGLAVFGYDTAHQIYQTYQEHADVRFAFRASSALGLDRYFDAESQKSEWWQTGVSIFGQAVLQGVGTKIAKTPVGESILAWRGQRIVSDLPQVGARGIYRAGRLAGSVPEVDFAALGKLTFDEQYAVGMFLLKEEQQLAKLGLVDDVRQYANRAFRALGNQAAGKTPKAELPALVRQIEAQATKPLDDFKAAEPPVDPLRAAKTAMSESRAYELAAAAYQRQQTLEAKYIEYGTAGTAAAKKVAPVEKPWPDAAHLPKPGVSWKTTVNGQEVAFEIESFVNAGEFSRVYKLKEVPKELGIATTPGKTYVMKIVKKAEEILAFEDMPAVKTNIIKRMIKGRDLLRKASIGQADFEAFEDAGILIQEYIPFALEPEKYQLAPKFSYMEHAANPTKFWAEKFAKDKHRAVAELFSHLGDAEIAFLDAHAGNIYFENEGGRWVAKILDQDFITEFAAVEEGVYGEFLAMLQNSMTKQLASRFADNALDPMYSTSRSFMQKIMEHQGWLSFDTEQGRYAGWILDPEEVKKVMPDLLYVPPPAPPPMLAPPIKKGEWQPLLQDPDRLREFANDNAVPAMLRIAA